MKIKHVLLLTAISFCLFSCSTKTDVDKTNTLDADKTYTLKVVDSILNQEVFSQKYEKDTVLDYNTIETQMKNTDSIRMLYTDSNLATKFSEVTMSSDKTIYLGLYEYADDLKLDLKYEKMEGHYFTKVTAQGFYTTYINSSVNTDLSDIVDESKFTSGQCFTNYDDLNSIFVRDYGLSEMMGEDLFQSYNVVVATKYAYSSTYKYALYRNLTTDTTAVNVDILFTDSYRDSAFSVITKTVDLILVPKSINYDISGLSFTTNTIEFN